MERYVYMWVEGYDNLHDFCKKRFRERPHFCETIGHCGSATIYLNYKRDKDGHYHEMYFLFMQHQSGTMSRDEITEKIYNTYCYEQIRTDRNSLLKR